jgi:hypothetical protein
MPISPDALPGDVSDSTWRPPRPVNSCPAGSVKPRQRPFEGAPVAGAPGWYVIRRTDPVPSGPPMRWSQRVGLTAVAVTVGLVALLLVLSMVRAPWSEAPAGQMVVVPMPPLAISPRPAPAPAPNTPIEEPTRPRDTLATGALQTKPDPVLPDELALLPLESIGALKRSTAEWESHSVPAAPSAARLPPTIGGAPSRVEEPRTVPVPSSRSSPQVADDSANLRSAARIQMASQAATADDNLALPAGETRVFIHHVADQRDGASAQQLAEYLRGQGFTVADIRSVDFGITKPSVRYFFARDRAASQRLVEELGRFSAGRASLAPDRASDFTHFVPKPRPGSLEVWLPGT